MSGGVDSSTTAFKLLKYGYTVAGITLSMGRNCDSKNILDARAIANKLGIKHYVLDVRDKFNSDVINYFINSYKLGETPNPCVMCNRFIKFKEIIEFMLKNNFDFMATGHYAKIMYNDDNVYSLHKANCLNKDQSYFLSMLKYDFLQYIKFPLGEEFSKDLVREEAKNFDFELSQKKDSQDVCFIETTYKDFLKDKVEFKPGLIKHVKGEILGKHSGIVNYTIGQRKGLGISYNKPVFVVRFDAINNVVYVSDDENDLYNDKLYIKNVNILSQVNENKNYTIKLRSTHAGNYGKIKLLENNRAEIVLKDKTRAITSGQLSCVYDDDKVVCAGWIE